MGQPLGQYIFHIKIRLSHPHHKTLLGVIVQEFPDLQVEERSAVSIARRLQDPLSELVKIDPKSIGVGQYQHDVAQKNLSDSLDFVIETAVNQVGVNVNTASVQLLQYVAGLNKTTGTVVCAPLNPPCFEYLSEVL